MPRSFSRTYKRSKRAKAARLRYSKIDSEEKSDTVVQAEGTGHIDGYAEGLIEGNAEGLIEGNTEGLIEGNTEGLIEGNAEGLIEGNTEGLTEGNAEGLIEGNAEGFVEGNVEGCIKVHVEENTEAGEYIEEDSDWEAEKYMKRIEEHQLTIEVVPKGEPIIKGNRIVELGYVLDWAITLQHNHSKICTTGKLSVKEEIRKAQGLISTVVFKCNLCSREYYFDTENPEKKESVINTGAMWGTLSTGSTYSHMSEFLGCMDVPTMPAKMFYNIENNLGEKCLTTLDLTSLGVGSCVGTGMYLVAGMVAKKVAGPGVIISFIIAAIASIFSGACYAEFGVRVPHTTGSAYMYSYVTVGEFIAFVIGWNMILEYLIGTSACACALSACFDALTNGAISSAIHEGIGEALGRDPDFLAFVITLLMMLLMAAGVKKSLIFNNILNVINLAVWVFVMTAGLFYVNTDNWTKHKGFLPKGWSGVFTGAATCFYAFIGFDIIATTGEEAATPKKSIPLAIVSSLAIILIAYVTSSMMITLIVPYTEVDEESALVEMFGQVGAYKCKYIVAVGALAGLTVSMFGSMFPMPRIIYAMAQDGLIFRLFSQVWPSTGTPVVATFVSGVAAAVAALFIRLEILVEMMSIGTLLAYTLVSTCVLILRYQPHSTNLVELLPQSLRTPLKGSPTKEGLAENPNGQAYYGNQLQPAQLKQAIASSLGPTVPSPSPSPLPSQTTQRVMVRRVTRSSPDSDDTFGGDEPEEDFSGRDDQFLVSDRTENKFYGTVHGGGSATSTGGVVGSTVGPSLGYIGRRLQAATYLCPAIFPWIDTGPATEESGMFVMKMVGYLYILIIILDLIIVLGMDDMNTATTLFLCLFLFAIIAICLVISRKPQNRNTLMFMTPGLPFIPVVAITVNIYLIMKLSILTLVRFTIWMTLGFIMYFYYGIKNSTLENAIEGDQNIELTVTDHEKQKFDGTSPYGTDHNIFSQNQPTYDWDPNKTWDHRPSWAQPQNDPPQPQRYQVEQHYNVDTNDTKSVINKSATSAQTSSGSSGLFVSDPLAFAKWDD